MPYDELVTTYLAECFTNGTVPRVNDLARRLGLSPWAFTRRYEHTHGHPPGAALRDAQLEHARRLLLHTEMNIKQVAHATGFTSTRAFHRAFKRTHDTTPQRYRGCLSE